VEPDKKNCSLSTKREVTVQSRHDKTSRHTQHPKVGSGEVSSSGLVCGIQEYEGGRDVFP